MRNEPDFDNEKQLILAEMNDYAMHAEYVIAKLVHPSLIKDFSNMLFSSWIEEQESALKIAQDLELSEIHFWALEGDFLNFRDCYRREKEERDGEAQYDSMQ